MVRNIYLVKLCGNLSFSFLLLPRLALGDGLLAVSITLTVTHPNLFILFLVLSRCPCLGCSSSIQLSLRYDNPGWQGGMNWCWAKVWFLSILQTFSLKFSFKVSIAEGEWRVLRKLHRSGALLKIRPLILDTLDLVRYLDEAVRVHRGIVLL